MKSFGFGINILEDDGKSMKRVGKKKSSTCSATGDLSDTSSYLFSLQFFIVPTLKSGDVPDPPADFLHDTLSVSC